MCVWAGGQVGGWAGELEGGGGGVFSSARTLHRVLSHEFDHARVLVEDGGVQLQPVVAHRVAYDGRSKQLLDGVEGVELDLVRVRLRLRVRLSSMVQKALSSICRSPE